MRPDELRGLRVAIYARYSSDAQREASIDDQVRVARRLVEAHGGAVEDGSVFADYAITAQTLRRDALDRLLAVVTARPRGADVIVVDSQSRLTRDFGDAGDIWRRLRYGGVRLLGADGTDTAAPGAKVGYMARAMVADLYLDDLRAATRRGLEGRALAGHSTGGLPYGYRSVPVPGPRGEPIGYAIQIAPERAAIVVWIFRAYLAGRSQGAIARELSGRGVPPPRAGSRHRYQGWVSSSVRALLHNPKYVGEWSYRATEWVRDPDSRVRRPRPRPADDVIRQVRPELAIVDQATWEAVQARLAGVRARYTCAADGTSKGRAVPSRSTAHPLSGLLVCGTCQHPMVMTGGSSGRKYYRCSHHRMRGTCANALAVREDVARPLILAAIRDLIASPDGIAYARQRIAARLGERSRSRDIDLVEARTRLGQTEGRMRRLVGLVADGTAIDLVRDELRALDERARSERAAVAGLERAAVTPLRLPSPDEVLSHVLDVERRLADDPVGGREALRRLLRDGRIVLDPQPEGHYVARSAILPGALLLAAAGVTPGDPSVYSDSSGGLLCAEYTAVEVPFSARLAA